MTKWYDNAIIYQVYPRSFQDSNNDGLGDLRGVIQRLDYIKALGVNTIWLNPVFTSPQVDNGYDVSNYYTIDPKFGDMATMTELIDKAHALGLHVLLDFVLNHTSDKHPWFQDALKSPNSLFRDYYIWEKTTNGLPPDNWGSFFGGSVWAEHPSEPGSYYFHLFDQHMPDLNWKNPEVREAMIEVAKFWVEKGVDGLRLDAFIHIAKGNLHQNYPTDSDEPVVAEPMFANLPNVVTYLQEFVQELRKINPNLYILGEGASADPNLAALYTRPVAGSALCDAIVSFRNLPKQARPQTKVEQQWHLRQQEKLDLAALPDSIVTWQTVLAQTTEPVLYFSNHDMPRMATVYADPEAQEQSLKTLATMLYLQKGAPIIYYGEELGLTNVELTRFAAFQDNTVAALKDQVPAAEQSAVLKDLSQTHKTAARQVMPWDDTPNQGFSKHEPWLRVKGKQTSVAEQEQDSDSVLNFYRSLLRLKQTALFMKGDFCLLNSPAKTIVFTRELNGKVGLVLTNLSAQSVAVSLPDLSLGKPELAVGHWQITDSELQLAPWSSAVFMTEHFDN
ncbi:glycoside hydrolase family 13 protein [Lapidilactobacillus bayanensis]|uniref:glycoside hydrolase family 13 protein n=1 Tax=Lapidilactobacillus bayanensis TaxID=2485998 RepID=UPI000F7998DA|nr:alpha-glucosidase [Lapidilactobacillus bayanensis]